MHIYFHLKTIKLFKENLEYKNPFKAIISKRFSFFFSQTFLHCYTIYMWKAVLLISASIDSPKVPW